jgi:hypothetical protein
MSISDRAAIRQLAGEHHELVDLILYEEPPREYDEGWAPTRDYGVQIKRTVAPVTPRAFYWVLIGLSEGGPVSVRVEAVGRESTGIGSFELSYDEYPSPIWLDPAAVSRALTEIILPDLRRHCPQARLPEA